MKLLNQLDPKMHIRFRLNFMIFLFMQAARSSKRWFAGKHHKYIAMKLLRSFMYAFNGIRLSFTSELNFRIHVLLAIVAIGLAMVLQISIYEWLILGFCIAFVLVVEMLNTALEKLCDVVHPDEHPGIKKVKDIAAGAVLISAIFSVVAGLVMFIPKLIPYLNSFLN